MISSEPSKLRNATLNFLQLPLKFHCRFRSEYSLDTFDLSPNPGRTSQPVTLELPKGEMGQVMVFDLLIQTKL